MWLLLLIPVSIILANVWLAWTSRTRRAPEIAATIAAHQRLGAAMAPERARSKVSAG